MKEVDVYLFGQILGTHSFLLKDGFLKPDEYSEIKKQYFLPGGETGTAATVLDSMGVTVRFASACSAVAISRFPLPLNPPKMDEVNELLR